MDIYTDYANWKFENYEFIDSLVKAKSKTISRFTSVIAVVDYLYDQVVNKKVLSQDEEVIFSTGFDYICDQFLFIKSLFEYKFNSSYKEMEKYSKTINLLLYIHEFQAEALNYSNVDTKPLDDLEMTVLEHLDQKKNVEDGSFVLLNESVNKIFEQKNISVHTIDQIFYEIALEYGIYKEDDFDLYQEVLNRQIEKSRKK